jgi:3-methyl-2-oxobutanoate hydroxymethyltransferase
LGIVLGNGGALAKMIPPFKIFAGGPIGKGRQWFSWIHLEDLVNLIIESIKRILTAGIPVMGHLGLTPQSIYKFGTYVVRAKEEDEANRLISDAKLLEEAGCFAIVLEKIPAHLAEMVAKTVSIPIIGIGAGNCVDGQVLVVHDMLGINNEFSPRFLRKYNNLYDQMFTSFQNYISDVKSGDFPNQNEQY